MEGSRLHSCCCSMVEILIWFSGVSLSNVQLQPSTSALFEVQSISNFISSFGKDLGGLRTHSTWMKSLSNFSTKSFTARSAIRAVLLALYETHAADGSHSLQSEHLYIVAVQKLQHRIKRYLSPSCDDNLMHEAPDEIVCTAMMLGYFELIQSRSNSSWMRHFDGAVALLETRGPERCQDGLALSFLLALRSAMVCPAMYEFPEII